MICAPRAAKSSFALKIKTSAVKGGCDLNSLIDCFAIFFPYPCCESSFNDYDRQEPELIQTVPNPTEVNSYLQYQLIAF
jgi:hypothetical protein